MHRDSERRKPKREGSEVAIIAMLADGSKWRVASSDSSAPAFCTAGPGSNLGSAPQRRPSTERKVMRTTRVVLYE